MRKNFKLFIFVLERKQTARTHYYHCFSRSAHRKSILLIISKFIAWDEHLIWQNQYVVIHYETPVIEDHAFQKANIKYYFASLNAFWFPNPLVADPNNIITAYTGVKSHYVSFLYIACCQVGPWEIHADIFQA